LLSLCKDDNNAIFAIDAKCSYRSLASVVLIYLSSITSLLVMSNTIDSLSFDLHIIASDNYAKVLTKNVVLQMLQTSLFATNYLMLMRRSEMRH